MSLINKDDGELISVILEGFELSVAVNIPNLVLRSSHFALN
jgi:hypothetical protein